MSTSVSTNSSNDDPPPSYYESYIRPKNLEKERPTLVPFNNFNAVLDCRNINRSLSCGDKKGITNILCKRTLSQRLEIAETYKNLFKINLIDAIKLKINGNIKSLFINLLMPTSELYCRQLRKSENDGLLTDLALTLLSFSTQYDYGDANYDDDALIEILCTMSNSNIRKICATYQQIFSKRLDQEIREGKTGNYKKLLLILSEGNRDESISCDPQSAKNQAIVLEKKLSQSFTDEKTIIEMLAKKSFRQINLISEEYRKRTGNLLEKDIKKRMSAKLKDALVAIVRASKNIAEFYARRINKSINYFNLDHHNLGRLIVARCEIDLMNIQDEFKFIFRESLQSRMETITSGNYKHALLTLLNA